MSVVSLLNAMRPRGRWSKEARIIYTSRRLLTFYNKHPELIQIAIGNNPNNQIVWNGIFRFFFRHFPTRTDTYISDGKVVHRSWWYQEETFDPKWDRFMIEYKADFVFDNFIRPYLKHQKGGV